MPKLGVFESFCANRPDCTQYNISRLDQDIRVAYRVPSDYMSEKLLGGRQLVFLLRDWQNLPQIF